MKEANPRMPGPKQTQALAALKATAERNLRRVWRALPPEQKARIRKAAHPATLAKAQRQVSSVPGSAVQRPQLAIIVSLTDHADDPAGTLRSLVGQKPSALEIIVVDTTGGSLGQQAVQEFAERDGRVRYVMLPGFRAEEARERAIAQSQAPYLMFLSAGDIIEKNCLGTMLTSLRETDSSFAVGMTGVAKGKTSAVADWQRNLHSDTRPGVNLSEIPEIMQDGALANKVFARTFWTSATADIPQDRDHWQYQAVPSLYLRAPSFDVLDVKVVSTSLDAAVRPAPRELICNLQYLEDRLHRLQSLAEELRRVGAPAVYQRALSQELGNGLFRFYEVVPRTQQAYWDRLHAVVSGLCEGQELNWDLLRIHNRLILSAVLADRREDVVRICNHRSDYGSSFPTLITDAGPVATPRYLDELSDYDPALLPCRDVDLRLVSKMTHFAWRPDGLLEIGGHAYASSVDPIEGGLSIQASLVSADTQQAIQLTVQRYSDSSIDWESNDNWTSYAEAGFRTTIDPAVMLASEHASQANWHVVLTVSAGGRTLSAPLSRRDLNGSTGQLPVGPLLADARMAVEMRPATTGLTFVPVTPLYVATSIMLTGRTLELTVESRSAPLAAKVSIESPKFGIRKTATCLSVEGNTAVYVIDVPPLGSGASATVEYGWQLRLDSGFKTPQPVAWPEGSADLEAHSDQTRSLRLGLTGYGFITVEERKNRVIASSVEVSADKRYVRVEGTADLPVIHAPRFVLSSGKAVIPATDVVLTVRTNDGSNTFAADFLLPQNPWGGKEVMPEIGAYSVRFVPPGVADHLGYWFPASSELQTQMPRRIEADRLEVGVSRSAKAGALTVHLRPPFTSDELGRFNQQTLRTPATAGGDAELKDAVLFMCFGGRRATDSPRRLLEEFQRRGTQWPMYWAVADFSVPVPVGTKAVLIGSVLWYQLLTESRILINNNNFPFYFRKRPEQVYIQTWHGTPLKKLGNDVARTNFSLSYWNLMWREAGYWDALLAQNSYAADVLANCFGFDGRVVAEGYPRNDSLTAERMEQDRPAIRRRLGIPDGKTAILYAPTWRDDARTASKQYEMVTYLDFEAAQQALGEDYVLLLRGHHNIASQRQTASNKFVIDVTEYPEVNDLYTAADILVNDYSSVMFDFCVTGKPILFLTPDIAQYRDSTRGFYFDLEEKAPGPLHSTTDEVVRSIKNIGSVSRRYAPKYEAFVEMFAPHCDGSATTRVFDALWPEVPGVPLAVGASHLGSETEQ
ncbi:MULTISPECIES: CDP-glycerol:glycerophosphate glycerophosphotransferase [unclassified Arthrobacter]|uniref:CDP-glycerol:glycerophosphate glycerophosphotransferase n=1 Tax=unclassified Arthrobacter TaxID=235627 RepID=UPI002E03A7FF|nr:MULTISPECIES: CDP-glycerol:glycerophosphate glycerophosphotransferase [unclassified Arthrobacter]MEC5190995.1 CDP-glycerol glycerophosphotransferase [Arthrobacter sp. MP_M4]MEC5202166.1 CDP-glycerol glycerophosphotransferase [Arthrobacter sp. MP_M7]